jgi:hypothetical protein
MIRFLPMSKARRVFKVEPGWTRPLVTLANSTEKAMQEAFRAAIDEARKHADVEAIAKAVEAKNMEQAAAAAHLNAADQGTTLIEDELRRAMVAAGNLEAGAIPTAAGAVLNPYAETTAAWLREHTAEAVKGINAGTRETISALTRYGIENGVHPYETAKAIKGNIGLLPRQSLAVEKYKAALLEAGKSAEKVEKLAAKYADKLLAQRAETIARTEAMSAINHGKTAMREQLQAEGVISEDQEYEWLTAEDERRVCEVCRSLHGERAKLGEPFGDTDITEPPAHPD